MILENYWYVKKKMGNSNRKSQIVTKTINITPPIKHPDEHPPRITDKYFITSAKIGQGSFSKVMLGVNLETKTEVVIKVIPKDRSKDEEFTKRECEICLKLNHQYIVKYYDYFETSDFVYIVCEYCKGGELFKNIKRSDHFPEDTSKRYFVQVLSALEYLHTHFIAHRDLKSENIWLDSKGNVKLGDFGMATNVTDTRRMTQCGSLGYFEPEVIKENGYHPLISEIWSVGIVLYTMLFGECPFGVGRDYISNIMTDRLQLEFNKEIVISEDAKDLLRQMLDVDHTKRISLDRIKNHEWLKGVPEDTSQRIKYPKLESVTLDKIKYIVNLGYSSKDVYRAIFENDQDSIYLGMYHNLTLQKPDIRKLQVRSFSAPTSNNIK